MVCLALLSVVDDASAQEDVKAIHNLALQSSQPGEFEITWDVTTETPVDYRLVWARDGERFKTWTDLSGNAFATTNPVTSLDDVRYIVKVRARYDDDEFAAQMARRGIAPSPSIQSPAPYTASTGTKSRAVSRRAGNRCEWCAAHNHKPHPLTGSRVVLTVAHLDHNPANNAALNLAARCQRCHNQHDGHKRAQNGKHRPRPKPARWS